MPAFTEGGQGSLAERRAKARMKAEVGRAATSDKPAQAYFKVFAS